MRGLISLAAIGAAVVVLGVPAALAGVLDRSGDTTQRLVALWARFSLAWVGVRLECSGADAVPGGPVVFASNHTSAIDVPLLCAALPTGFRFMHKRSLYLVPIIGQILLLGGHIGVDRRRAFRARRSLELAAARVRSGTSVLVFPEGTRSREGRMGSFKRGSFKLAIQAGVPVVPLSLAGVRDVIPAGPLSLRPARVRVTIHTPVSSCGRTPEQLAAQVEAQVRSALEGE